MALPQAEVVPLKHRCFLFHHAALITDSSSISRLYLMGFGKGTLSRSRPMYGKTATRDLEMPERLTGPSQSEFHRKRRRLNPPVPLPAGVEEPLQLMHEEAYFLARAGLVVVLTTTEVLLTDDGEGEQSTEVPFERLWLTICALSPQFPYKFKVYDFYRRRGWAPKGGLKFGADLVLYYQSAEQYHSKYAVLIEVVDADGRALLQEERPNKHWLDLLGNNRVASQAKKQTLRCTVTVPADADLQRPESLEVLRVSEVALRRWKT